MTDEVIGLHGRGWDGTRHVVGVAVGQGGRQRVKRAWLWLREVTGRPYSGGYPVGVRILVAAVVALHDPTIARGHHAAQAEESFHLYSAALAKDVLVSQALHVRLGDGLPLVARHEGFGDNAIGELAGSKSWQRLQLEAELAAKMNN
eukprot:6213678-Pleurochrysis_carterae.AAC.4